MARDLTLRLRGARFANPVLLASGPAGYGTEYAELIELARLGGVVTKTITLEPWTGNRGRRLWETSAGLLNSIGLENVGAERFFSEKLGELGRTGAKPVVSLGAEDWDSYRRLLERTAAQEDVDAVEINLSCPNVDGGGMVIGSDPVMVDGYVRLAREALGEAAIFAKLTPNVADITLLARAAEEGGADAVTAINTVVGAAIDAEGGWPVFERVRAGLSGPAILPIALDAVWRISRAVHIPVIGVGGISSVEDARAFFAAGAAAIQIGTAIFYDPALPLRIVAALERDGVPKPCAEGRPEEP